MVVYLLLAAAAVVVVGGSEFSAPDHRVYQFSNGRGFDSTDRGVTGFYTQGVLDILTEYGVAINMEPPGDSVGDPILME